VATPTDLYLQMSPAFVNAETSGVVSAGNIHVSCTLPAASTVIVIGTNLGLPAAAVKPVAASGSYLTLDPSTWIAVIPGNTVSLALPAVPSAIQGIVPHFQALTFVPGFGIVMTNDETIRIDLGP